MRSLAGNEVERAVSKRDKGGDGFLWFYDVCAPVLYRSGPGVGKCGAAFKMFPVPLKTVRNGNESHLDISRKQNQETSFPVVVSQMALGT